MDEARLAELEALCARATPGPWRNLAEGFFRPEDSTFICTARTALPEALAEIRRLRTLLGAAPLLLEALEANEEVDDLQQQLGSGVRTLRTASDKVKRKATLRLIEAQQRWWKLRSRALKAARGEQP